MSEQVNRRMLTCTADGYIYHIWGDDRYLYFDKMGRDGGDSEDTMLGSTRVVKSMVEAVRCTRVRGETIILIVFEGETSHLVVKGNVKEETLIKIFGGVPLKLSINLYSNVLTDAYELRLLSYCFIVAIMRLLCNYMPEIAFLAPVVELGWVVLPFLWLIPCASRMLKGGLRDQFPVGAGMLATAFCCIFLWATSVPGVNGWLGLIIPSLVGAVIIGAVYLMARRKMDWRALTAVVLVSLICFTPAASLCINGLTPWKVQKTEATVVGLDTERKYGNSYYHMDLDVDGATSRVRIDSEEYAGLTEGDSVEIVNATGLLGIGYTEVNCG